MRIVIIGPPKAGNWWMKHILSTIYHLQILLAGSATPSDADAFVSFVKQGRFPDGTIFHQHFAYDEAIVRAAASIGCPIVTTIRDPYDSFVSFYHAIQRAPNRFVGTGTAQERLIGKEIDHPDVLAVLEGPYHHHLAVGASWLRSGKSIVVRYEEMQADAFGQVKRVTDRISPVDDDTLRAAIEASTPDAMRTKSDMLARHIRSATVGDWQNHLSERHLNIFRSHHGALVRELGYSVR